MTVYRLLIVEDDMGIAEAIRARAASWELESRIVTNFRDVMQEFGEYDPQLVLLDITLPFYSGYYWCERIRKISQVPILFVSSAGDNMNIVMAMNMGADDFIVKPFDGDVLMAKVNAILRRTYHFTGATSVMECHGAILNTASSTLTYGEETVDLTKNEHRILLTLLENRGKVVSREKLMETLWKTDSFVDENTLTVNVGRLRKKLESVGLSNVIVTKFGAGYLVE